MDTMIWNVKNADTVDSAVSNMCHGIDTSVSPQCVTKKKPFGHQIDARRRLQGIMQELKTLACDDYYLANGLDDYKAACAKYFDVQQRRGYVQLTMK